jgi:hypothetical protein
VECESRTEYPYHKADPSLKSFLFTLKNPNCPARKFALRNIEKSQAIRCDSSCGPHFRDISISDNCNANASSFSSLGYSYESIGGYSENTFFTNSFHFTVKEIEVFEITG